MVFHFFSPQDFAQGGFGSSFLFTLGLCPGRVWLFISFHPRTLPREGLVFHFFSPQDFAQGGYGFSTEIFQQNFSKEIFPKGFLFLMEMSQQSVFQKDFFVFHGDVSVDLPQGEFLFFNWKVQVDLSQMGIFARKIIQCFAILLEIYKFQLDCPSKQYRRNLILQLSDSIQVLLFCGQLFLIQNQRERYSH